MSRDILIGRRVRFAAWDDLKEIVGVEPVGTITNIIDFGKSDLDLQVRLDGVGLKYTFGLAEVEFLPTDELPYYTPTDPAHQGDRIRLYPAIEAAWADARGRPIYAVAVRLDSGRHRLSSLWTLMREIAPGWATPAELHHDGSVTARGPIPAVLFVKVRPPPTR